MLVAIGMRCSDWKQRDNAMPLELVCVLVCELRCCVGRLGTAGRSTTTIDTRYLCCSCVRAFYVFATANSGSNRNCSVQVVDETDNRLDAQFRVYYVHIYMPLCIYMYYMLNARIFTNFKRMRKLYAVQLIERMFASVSFMNSMSIYASASGYISIYINLFYPAYALKFIP